MKRREKREEGREKREERRNREREREGVCIWTHDAVSARSKRNAINQECERKKENVKTNKQENERARERETTKRDRQHIQSV
jgi:hypothetical protein